MWPNSTANRREYLDEQDDPFYMTKADLAYDGAPHQAALAYDGVPSRGQVVEYAEGGGVLESVSGFFSSLLERGQDCCSKREPIVWSEGPDSESLRPVPPAPAEGASPSGWQPFQALLDLRAPAAAEDAPEARTTGGSASREAPTTDWVWPPWVLNFNSSCIEVRVQDEETGQWDWFPAEPKSRVVDTNGRDVYLCAQYRWTDGEAYSQDFGPQHVRRRGQPLTVFDIISLGGHETQQL
mmetsp:Transcript_81556/g.231115  ORF Transcript_81556/g.231115 Transcript_81556/m.231115 type:complete len:239 (-) Transcript_81556:114-830(-)